MVADVIGQLARLDKSAGPEEKAYTEPPRPGPGVLGWGLPPQGLDPRGRRDLRRSSLPGYRPSPGLIL